MYLYCVSAPEELSCIIGEVRYRTGLQSAKLLRQLKRRDRLSHKLQKNYDIITACLQAVSQKRRVDTRLKFTIEPSLGKNGFQQWYDALKAVVRLPTGIPKEWRKRVWLTLADQYLHSISIDWDKTLRFAFNERSNPDDDSLGIQIVKDLHRTGCSSYSGQEGEQDRVVLKRVLLAYARWNKAVGYCQGFNVLAALILEVTEGNESHALKVMIYLIDKVLPESYFANNLRSLSVDMAVFRDLLRMKLPHLSQHLHLLQKTADREAGGSYEPPLTNVFTMQWFLTMFATCLPPNTVLKIWDSVFFEGSEVLLRVALAIWSHLGEHIEYCQTADEFYSTMGWITQEMLENSLIDCSHLMQTVYSMAVFPFPQLAELREKYTYNITPFPTSNPNGSGGLGGWEGDEDEDEDEDAVVTAALGCLGPLGGLLAPELQRYQRHIKDQRGGEQGGNMADLSPGAVDGGGRAEHQAAINSMLQERMSTDITALKKQYSRIKRHQQQQARQLYIHTDRCPATSVLASQLHPSPVVNHLLLGRKPRNSLKHPPSSPSSLRGVPLPQAQSSPATPGPAPNPTPSGERGRNRLVSQAENCQSRVGSPWRAHVRAHRRNIARARVQLGFGDMEDRHPHKSEEDGHPHQTEEDRHPHQTEERDGVGEGKADDDEGSHLPVSPAQASSKEVPAVVEEEEHLLSLELDSGSELNQTPPPLPSSPGETDPDTLPSSPRGTDPPPLPSSPRETDPPPLPSSPRETDLDTLPSSPRGTDPPPLPSSPRETDPPPLPSSPRQTDPDPLPCSPRETDPDTLPSSPRETDPDTLPSSPRETDPDTLPSSPRETDQPPLPSSPRETDPDTLPSSPRETDPDTLPSSPRGTDPDTLPSSPRGTDPDTLPSSPTIPELSVLPPLPRPPSSHHHHQSDPSISSQNIYCMRLSPGSPVTLTNTSPPVTLSNPPTPVTLTNPPTPVTLTNPPPPVTLSNPPPPVTLTNPPPPVTLTNSPTPVTLTNPPPPVTLSNPPPPVTLSNPPTFVTLSNPPPPVTLSNPPPPVTLSNPPPPVTLTNPPTPVTLTNPPTPVTLTNPPPPVTLTDPPPPVTLTNPPPPVTLTNPPPPVTITNPPPPVTLSNPPTPGTLSKPPPPVTLSNPPTPLSSPVTITNPPPPVTLTNPPPPLSNPHTPGTPLSPSIPLSCPSTPQDQPRATPQQVFSPFPSVKQHRRSAAARNLGLYGPTARTPTVHFPQLSLNRPSSTLSTRKR
ncbi:TBC1 domain family member 30-like [Oncorhynchus mykiss]|uniref:TBC1 domain family member 30-like n=1 Tax=Oncorhynchus mykiss TaxID=8022 RepID=UPI00187762CA|nr:TBC1 domain family member 30-like [Oncorhynchus mykiss]